MKLTLISLSPAPPFMDRLGGIVSTGVRPSKNPREIFRKGGTQNEFNTSRQG
jgi:hypothetical protein